MPKTWLGYGSQQGCRAGNFHPKCRKRGSGTEVSKGAERETSVQNTENVAWVRKSARVQGRKLPSKMPKTGLGYGSQRVASYLADKESVLIGKLGNILSNMSGKRYFTFVRHWKMADIVTEIEICNKYLQNRDCVCGTE